MKNLWRKARGKMAEGAGKRSASNMKMRLPLTGCVTPGAPFVSPDKKSGRLAEPFCCRHTSPHTGALRYSGSAGSRRSRRKRRHQREHETQGTAVFHAQDSEGCFAFSRRAKGERAPSRAPRIVRPDGLFSPYALRKCGLRPFSVNVSPETIPAQRRRKTGVSGQRRGFKVK